MVSKHIEGTTKRGLGQGEGKLWDKAALQMTSNSFSQAAARKLLAEDRITTCKEVRGARKLIAPQQLSGVPEGNRPAQKSDSADFTAARPSGAE